jgi:hypothetical protein
MMFEQQVMHRDWRGLSDSTWRDRLADFRCRDAADCRGVVQVSKAIAIVAVDAG